MDTTIDNRFENWTVDMLNEIVRVMCVMRRSPHPKSLEENLRAFLDELHGRALADNGVVTTPAAAQYIPRTSIEWRERGYCA